MENQIYQRNYHYIPASTDKLHIVIPTYKRESIEDQIFYNLIPDSYKEFTHFLVREERYNIMKETFPDANYIIIPKGKVYCIADTRQFLLENSISNKIWFVDDKVFLYEKRDEKFRIKGKISNDSFSELYNLIDKLLDNYCYVGISENFRNNLKTEPYSYVVPIYSCFGLRVDILNSVNARYDTIYKDNGATVAEDKYMVAYLLEKGYSNIMINDFVFRFKGKHGQEGGNFGLRTQKASLDASNYLMGRWPNYTNLRKSTTDSYWSKNEKEEDHYYAVIYWKKLFKNSMKLLSTSSILDI